MDDVKQQVVDRLKQANNILVTVRNSPNVDLLSACIGLALVLDKLDKHAAAVFSGEVPSAMEFLKPEETIEQTPNSLRDFIIALDKSKADKLRYKVEDKVVRIFITPYRTSITQDDLNFSQGDFNIDVVVALGAHEQQELDQAITAHGRILHDATIISVNNTPNGNLGSLNWQDQTASSISEMVAQLASGLGQTILDEQIATALLTGIVAETGRFSNEKTSPRTMSIAGDLMAAGADQQLVANKLQEGGHVLAGPSVSLPGEPKTPPAATSENGTLEIEHQGPKEETPPPEPEKPDKELAAPEPQGREMLPMPEPGQVPGSPLGGGSFTGEFGDEESQLHDNGFLVDRPEPTGGANSTPGLPKVPLSPFDMPPLAPPKPVEATEPPKTDLLPLPEPAQPELPKPAESQPAGQTLEEIEASVHSPHLDHEPAADEPVREAPTLPDADAARQNVLAAFQSVPSANMPARPEPVVGLNANPLGPPLHPADETPESIHIDEQGNLQPSPGSEPVPAPETEAEPADLPPMTLPLPQVKDSGLGSMPMPNAQPPTGPGDNENGTVPPPPIAPPMTPFAS